MDTGLHHHHNIGSSSNLVIAPDLSAFCNACPGRTVIFIDRTVLIIAILLLALSVAINYRLVKKSLIKL